MNSMTRANRIAASLMAVPFLQSISRDEIISSTPLWSRSRLDEGQTLWKENEAVGELAVVLNGALVARSNGVDVGQVGEGELVGEASIFFPEFKRSASLISLSSAELLKLSLRGLKDLRKRRSDVYQALLEQALLTLARRVRATDRQIAQLASGCVDAPVRRDPSALSRLWKSIRRTGATHVAPPLGPLLRHQPALREVDKAVLEELKQHFEPRLIEKGESIFFEGEKASAAYLLAEGQIEVLRNVRMNRAEPLATLLPGDQFGINALIEDSTRTASCVAVTSGWLYQMDLEAFRSLTGEARLIWFENLLASLANQIRNANALLERYRQETAAAEKKRSRAQKASADTLGELLQTSGYLGAMSTSASELDRVKLVVDEDQVRNFKEKGIR